MADGAILLGHEESKDEITQLMNDDYPFVYVGRRDVPGGSIVYSAADYAAATAEVVNHLFDLGHRNIMMLGSQGIREPIVDRQKGFEAAHHSRSFSLPYNYRCHIIPETIDLFPNKLK